MPIENGAESSAPGINSAGAPPPSISGEPKRRGRPPGSKNKPQDGNVTNEIPVGGEAPKRGRPRKERVELDRGAVARQLLGSHMMIANMLGLPELMLTEKEADQEAEAICDFAREYDFEPDPKLMASINLIATMGFIYVPKVIKVTVRIKKAKAAKGQTIDGEATEVPSGPSNGAATPAG